MNRAVVFGIAKDWALALGITLAVFFVWGWITGPDTLDAGTDAPDFILPTLDGETVSLAQLQGEVTVINFWATWCGPCREEFPDFAEFHEDNPGVNLVGISVDAEQPAPYVGRVAEQLGATWPILLDPDGVASGPYGVDILPTTVVLDPHGHISTVHVGKATRRQLDKLVSGATH